MTFAELKSEVFRRLEESSASPVYWTEADVEAALNEAYAEISDQTEWHETYRTVDLLDLRPWYDARTVLGASFLTLRAAFNDTTNRWLRQVRPWDLDRSDRRWERVTGTPEAILTRGLWWFGYWPRQASDAGTVKQHFTALPADLLDDLDEPGFPAAFHQGLVEGALADLWAQDGESDLALAAWGQYLSYEAGLMAYVQDRAGVPMVAGYGAIAR